MLLDPNNTGEVELATRNPTTGVTTLGKVIGPDGKPFFKVDAPHDLPLPLPLPLPLTLTL